MNSISLLTILVISIILISGCTLQKNKDVNEYPTSDETQTNFLKGVSLSPKSFESTDFTDFFIKAKKIGDVISWAGDWNELSNSQSAPYVINSLASTYDYTPIIELQFFTQSTGKLLRPLDETTKLNYKNDIVTFVEKYKPKYLCIGIEVNILYEKSPEDFNDFVSFYNDIYTTLKLKSPDTKVFTIFQLEKMKGINGGLFGETKSSSQWFLLDKFQTESIAFTTYPSLIYKSPSEIPSDYYTEIESYTKKPIIFTEIGWHSDASPNGWESSEEEQSEFITIFFELTKNLNKEIIIWSFMYDPKTIEPFNSMGLIDKNEKTKLAYNSFREL